MKECELNYYFIWANMLSYFDEHKIQGESFPSRKRWKKSPFCRCSTDVSCKQMRRVARLLKWRRSASWRGPHPAAWPSYDVTAPWTLEQRHCQYVSGFSHVTAPWRLTTTLNNDTVGMYVDYLMWQHHNIAIHQSNDTSVSMSEDYDGRVIQKVYGNLMKPSEVMYLQL